MGLLRQLLCSGVVCYLSISMGITITWPSSTIMLFISEHTTLHRPMTETELSHFGGLSTLGALFGTPIAGFLLDIIGRKYSAIVFSLMHVICWIMVSVSNRVEVLLMAMFISGIGSAAFVVALVFISEICHESIRGGMTAGVVIFYYAGMVICHVIGGYMDYYAMVYVFLSIAIGGVLLLGFLKKSPLFLMMKGREQEAATSLSFFYNMKIDSQLILHELDTIRRTLKPNLDESDIPEKEFELTLQTNSDKLTFMRFIRKSYSTRRALVVALILMTASTFQGLVVVQVYAEPLFSEAIPTVSKTLSSMLFYIIIVIAGFLAAYLSDVVGRKPLLLYSSIGTGVCLMLLGSQFHVFWGQYATIAVLIYLFCIAYSLGPGIIAYVITAELFLPKVKSLVIMLIIEWGWLCYIIVLFIFIPLITAIGLGPTLYVLGIISFFTAAFTHFFLPETKGLPVHAIQTLFSKKKRHVPNHL